ncbi:MAG TPA: S8 family serine peptidase [Pyrinomonadaceae bacterium]|nr:S8 family serine peptidase [Pyrinomonadaceae bacterium]
MFRSPSGRKSSIRAPRRRARLFVFAVALFAFAAALPYLHVGASGQQEEDRATRSQVSQKGQANIIGGAQFVPGEVLVRFRTETAAKTAEAVSLPLRAADDGSLIEVDIESFGGSETVRGLRLAKVDPARTLEAVAELAARSDVLYAEPNYIWRATRTPNDPRYTSGEMYGLNRIGAPAAWDTTTGSKSVVIGVLDGGVDINHPDLSANIWTNPGEVPGNNFDDDGNGFVDDVNGWDFHHNDRTVFDNELGDDHATHVAGTIGAKGNNGIGVTGVNWDVSIVSMKVLGPDGGNTANIISGYNYARRLRQAGVNLRVLNNSYGGPGKSLAALDAINQLNSVGILFVVAAGNSGRDNFSIPDYPASYDAPNLIAVASTNSTDGLSSFSNFGARLVSIGAPGSNILSTTPNNTYSPFDGTSMSSPHVAGAAALICAAIPACANSSAVNSGITTAQLRGALAFTGDRVSSLEGKTTTGRRLNVANAMASALENDVTAPATAANFRVTGQTGRNVTLAWTAPGDDGNAGTVADYDFFFVNSTGQAKTFLPTTLVPADAGTQQVVTVDVPFRNFSGTIQLRAYDNAGNSSTTSVSVTVPVNAGSDPYTVALSAAQPLTPITGSSIVTGDDKYVFRNLPFPFPFYGVQRTSVTVSTNGVLYFSTPGRRDNGDADDVPSEVESMQGQAMIAGLWDDIDINTTIRPGSGVYVIQPDGARIIFRWQGVTFSSPRVHINFEIELRNNGTIQMRYGDNSRVFPVVGMSSGEPDAYVVTSHTRECVANNNTCTSAPINLSNAQTVTFAPRVDQFFSISGRVTDTTGAGVPAVTLFLTGGQNTPTMTDSNGNYAFNGLAGGASYTVTPSHPNYNFMPLSINIQSLTSDQGANFNAFSNAPTGANSVAFAQTAYQHTEGDGSATFNVTRTGDTSGTVTVSYRTIDTDNFTVGCADPVNNQGGAFARCDFATTVGTLSFAAGELTKSVIVPIIDDAHDENSETFQLQLTAATGTGTSLGAQRTATATITDNDTGTAPNPVVNSIPFFVRQQYLDFLSREPEAGEPWSGVLTRCPNIHTGPSVVTDCDLIAVSQAFFGAPEFRLKGGYVFRFYKVAFGRLPEYAEIVSDMSFVAGATEQEVYARRAAFAVAFSFRPDFLGAYSSMSNAQFVQTLFARYGLTSVTTPDPGTPDSDTRVTYTAATFTSQLDANFLTRAQVLRAIADSDQVQAAEFNSAFVAVQYYGYLRRTPEPLGYQQNLDALNRGVSPREMVNAFLNSAEYRLRFGQP